MTGFKFIKDRWLLLVFYFAGLIILDFILWLDPNHAFNWDSLFYLNLLLIIFFICFLIGYYLYLDPWFQALTNRRKSGADSLNWPLTEAKNNEQQLVQDYANDLLQQHQIILTQTLDQQQNQKEFIESWVHEIKVPLAATQLLLESSEDDLPEQKYYQVENELQKINHYIEQVLYYTRLDDFSKDYLIQEYSLNKIVQAVIFENRNYFIQKHLHLVQPKHDEVVLTDEKWLKFILQQIFNNSIKYTPEAGTITVDLTKDNQGVWLAISDSGIGIPVEDQKRIFEKGFTGSNGRKVNQHATGLGLYLAKQLGEKLGHHFEVASTENRGTTVKILFPFLTYYNSADGKQIR